MPNRSGPVTVGDLLAEFPAQLHLLAGGPADATATALSGVTHDSRRVAPGDLYAALPGDRVHGARFAVDAVAAGAVAVLTDPSGAEACPAGGVEVPVLVHPRPRDVLGPLASAVHRHPSHTLDVVGVTGTNGKTTVTWLMHHMLRSRGIGAGLVGTVAVRVHDDEVASVMTTPEATDLQATLARMRDAGVSAVALEVSSHALALQRADGTRMAVVCFTNLSRDHLDFHGDMESYLAAKTRLFTGGFAARAVVCVDDHAGRGVAAAARAAGLDVWTVATAATAGADRSGPPADVVLLSADTGVDGRQRVRLRGPFTAGDHDELAFDVPMPGRHNAVNAVLALALVVRLAEGSPGSRPRDVAAEAAASLSAFAGVPGRMERIVDPASTGRTPLVVVDYAHTPEAVATALESLRAATPGRLVVVLGAGGDRDPGKRGPMGAAAAAAADVVVVTDDNPRGEDPAAVRAAVLAGAVSVPGRRAGDVVEVADRAGAIARGLAACEGPRDTLLVTGKGHETGQDYGGGRREPFDDRDAAARALQAWAREAGVADGEVAPVGAAPAGADPGPAAGASVATGGR
ncbi:MAG: UDP-N-acetylmuramoyl-L-alanyl-D-glutamate--2,6-diaminopimelate ligase [Kineosporiaceae bacterium]